MYIYIIEIINLLFFQFFNNHILNKHIKYDNIYIYIYIYVKQSNMDGW